MKKNYSPLRYPGGKSKLYPYVSELLKLNFKSKPIYVEAYAGGFGLGIELLMNDDVSQVFINDYDYCIYSFWKCVTSQKLHGKFIEKIETTNINIKTWKKQKEIYTNHQKYSMLEVGFATFFLNRTNRSGILLSNPIGGINQTGNYKIDCRFDRQKLISLINKIYLKRKQILVFNEDAEVFIPKIDSKYEDVFFNFDPPYVQAGPKLYKNSYKREDHLSIATIIQNVKNKWILTYDDDNLIRDTYSNFKCKEYKLRYSLQNKVEATELIIFGNGVKCNGMLSEQ